jgi:hypothetical protein
VNEILMLSKVLEEISSSLVRCEETIEAILSVKHKGIPLTPSQKNILESSFKIRARYANAADHLKESIRALDPTYTPDIEKAPPMPCVAQPTKT